MLAWSQVREIGMFYVLWILMGLCWSATLYSPSVPVSPLRRPLIVAYNTVSGTSPEQSIGEPLANC